MPKISVVIITYNEEDSIERCISSVLPVADDIVILDSYSTDKTETICKRMGARFFQKSFMGYRDQKNLALEYSKYDHILSLDADEALSEKLAESILKIKENWKFDGFTFNRQNYYFGKWIIFPNWSSDRKLRLFDKRKGRWEGLNIHETVKMQNGAKIGHLKGNLLHWSYSTYEEQVEKINKYSTLSAIEYLKDGRRSNVFKVIFSPIWSFFKSYIIKFGFLYGYQGFVLSSLLAYRCFFKYIKLKQLLAEEKQMREKSRMNI